MPRRVKKPLSAADRTVRYPIEGFDPRYRTILRRGILETIKLSFADYREARLFQLRLNTFRSLLRKGGDPEASSLYRARVSVHDNYVVIGPTDIRFAATLADFDYPKDTPLAPKAQRPQSSSQDTSPKVPLSAPIVPEPPAVSVDDFFSSLVTAPEPEVEVWSNPEEEPLV